MGLIPPLSGTRTANNTILASWDNTDFSNIRDTVNSYCLFKDVAITVTANHTYSPSSGVGITITSGGFVVSGGGITVTGNSTITGTLGGITTLTCTTLSATTINALAALELTAVAPTDALTFSATSARIQLPSSSLIFSDGSSQRLLVEAPGDVVVGTGTLATSATDGFLVIPVMTGAPVGTPSYNGSIVADESNNKIWVRLGGTWKGVVVS
jgi:hypothetical protein